MSRCLAFAATVVALALPAPASAVLPGENGLIVLASGRDADNDAEAKLHLLDVSGIPNVLASFTPSAGQHRHPSWSPDRTKVVYARGNPAGAGDFDLFIHDLETNAVTPLTTPGDNVSSDRPAWSPDGTRIAYEDEVVDGSNQRDILLHTLGAGTVNLTNSAGSEGKPAWTPQSNELYYQKGNLTPGSTDSDIVRRFLDGGTEQNVLATAMVGEAQPSISPDGQSLCFTRTEAGGGTEIYTAPIPSAAGNEINLTDDLAPHDYNCTWAPEGRDVAYVKGGFSAGALHTAEWPDNGIDFTVADDPGSNNFDGNPDWAPDGRPLCPDVSVEVVTGGSVVVPTECTDTGPGYERTDVREFLVADTGPTNGTATNPLDDDSNTSTYTPEENFIGFDSFAYTGFDKGGFAGVNGVVTVEVVAPGTQTPGGGGGPGQGPGPGGGGAPPPASRRCAGRAATIVGTAAANTIRGSSRRDVIVGLGGGDTILGLGGADIVCAGAGNDRPAGGTGNDRLFGQRGNDRLRGGRGNDRLSGGRGRDRLFGNRGRDLLLGGPGVDLLRGGAGRDRQRQ